MTTSTPTAAELWHQAYELQQPYYLADENGNIRPAATVPRHVTSVVSSHAFAAFLPYVGKPERPWPYPSWRLWETYHITKGNIAVPLAILFEAWQAESGRTVDFKDDTPESKLKSNLLEVHTVLGYVLFKRQYPHLIRPVTNKKAKRRGKSNLRKALRLGYGWPDYTKAFAVDRDPTATQLAEDAKRREQRIAEQQQLAAVGNSAEKTLLGVIPPAAFGSGAPQTSSEL